MENECAEELDGVAPNRIMVNMSLNKLGCEHNNRLDQHSTTTRQGYSEDGEMSSEMSSGQKYGRTYWNCAEYQSATPDPDTSPCRSACHSRHPHQARSRESETQRERDIERERERERETERERNTKRET